MQKHAPRLGYPAGCTAAAVAIASAGMAQRSEAAIVYSGVVNLAIPSTTNGLYLNVVTGQINEPGNTGGGSVPGWDVNPYGSAALTMFNNPNTPGGTYVIGGGAGASPANLPPGSFVSAASPFGGGNIATTGSFPFILNSTNNFVGFRFVNEANGNAVHYGWFRVGLAGTPQAQPRVLIDYAYESEAGVGIVVIFPAPGSLALLALGAAGLSARRRGAAPRPPGSLLATDVLLRPPGSR